VAHQTDGSGPPVVLSCSLGTALAAWDPQTAALSDRHRVVRYDHRGHGRSPVPPGPYSIADLGEDVVQLLDELDLPSVSFVGTSLGGMVGMWLASHVPERVDRLVLLCTAARLEPPETWLERATVVRANGTAVLADVLVPRWFTPAFRARCPDAVDAIVEQLRRTPSEGYAACCEAIAGMDLHRALAHIRAPTLVVAGAQDPATTVADAKAIVAAVDGARLEVVADAAHLANVERADVVTSLILEHLA
jgi:3-oxoadipate enol-lactonase